jgi:hypothetical protein
MLNTKFYNILTLIVNCCTSKYILHKTIEIDPYRYNINA